MVTYPTMIFFEYVIDFRKKSGITEFGEKTRQAQEL